MDNNCSSSSSSEKSPGITLGYKQSMMQDRAVA